MGIMQLWGGHDTDEDMARASKRTLDAAEVDTWVEQLKSSLKDTKAFKAVYSGLVDTTLSAADVIEIAFRFTGAKAKTKKAAMTAIGQERLRVSHARAKGESAAKTRTW